MSQNLRVALWVPNVDPANIGNAIRTIDVPSANKRIPSEFSAGGAGGGVSFADAAEVAVGTVTDEAISPATLRTEMMREFAMPAATFFTGPVVTVTFSGLASADKIVKTNASGLVDDTLLSLDGGTF